MAILLISLSLVARIIGMSYWYLAIFYGWSIILPVCHRPHHSRVGILDMEQCPLVLLILHFIVYCMYFLFLNFFILYAFSFG
jgi:hypothetical protein